MAKRKHRKIAASFLFGISVIAFVTTALTLGLLQGISQNVRAQMMLSTSLALFVCFAGLSFLAWDGKRVQIQTWRRAFAVWKERASQGVYLAKLVPIPLTPQALEKFTVSIFLKLGYRLIRQDCSRSGQKIHRMLNPEGQIELIQCIQRSTPVGLSEVCDLFERMCEAGARGCTLWAPGGFNRNAIFWAQGKPILLADRQEISRFVEAIFETIGDEEFQP